MREKYISDNFSRPVSQVLARHVVHLPLSRFSTHMGGNYVDSRDLLKVFKLQTFQRASDKR